MLKQWWRSNNGDAQTTGTLEQWRHSIWGCWKLSFGSITCVKIKLRQFMYMFSFVYCIDKTEVEVILRNDHTAQLFYLNFQGCSRTLLSGWCLLAGSWLNIEEDHLNIWNLCNSVCYYASTLLIFGNIWLDLNNLKSNYLNFFLTLRTIPLGWQKHLNL